MAITTNAPSLAKRSTGEKTFWAVNATSADSTGNETLKAAPGAGKALYVLFIHINCGTDTTVVINDATTALLGPFTFKAAGSCNIQLRFENPVKLTDNQALAVDAGAAGAVCVYVEGFTI